MKKTIQQWTLAVIVGFLAFGAFNTAYAMYCSTTCYDTVHGRQCYRVCR